MSTSSVKNLKSAIFSALLVLIIAYPVLGLKLTTVGISLEVHGATAFELWCIGGAAALIFVWQLLRDRITPAWAKRPSLPSGGQVGNFLTLPSTQRWIILAMLVGALVWPFFASRGAVDIATLILIYVMLGLGLNIVVGLAGLLDLGYVGFYAVGAYSYAILSHYFGLSFWMCLPIAGMMAALFGFLLGFPVLRLRGDYLAIVTLGFGEIIRILLNNWTSLTGGPNGIGGIPEPTLFGMEFGRRVKGEGNTSFHETFGIAYSSEHKVIFLYLIALLLAVFTALVIRRLMRMPVGRAWEALREDEIAARSLGLSRTAVKLSAFTIGAFFAGFAGTVFASKQGFISPESFVFLESAIVLAIVVLGGMGSQIGVILAATAVTILPELAREFSEYRMLVFGAAMVLMMIWRPQGLMPMRRMHIELKGQE